MNIVEKIKELQLQKEGKVSLNRLEQELNLGKSTISSWATKNPSADKLSKVADYFDCSVDYLLGRVDEPHEQIPVALYAPHGYENLTDEQKEFVQALIDQYAKRNKE